VAGLPDSVRALVSASPIEDLVLALLRRALPEVAVQSQITYHQPMPLILVRRTYSVEAEAPNRFVDRCHLQVQTFCEDPNGDSDAALLAEAARLALRDAWLDQIVIPGRGYLTYMQVYMPPRRVADWVTSSGPVQYADLPDGVWRYDAQYAVAVRRPLT
jgi:hypothetical protein